jgi:hypothetical protein
MSGCTIGILCPAVMLYNSAGLTVLAGDQRRCRARPEGDATEG